LLEKWRPWRQWRRWRQWKPWKQWRPWSDLLTDDGNAGIIRVFWCAQVT
jgi:hypothetical protein